MVWITVAIIIAGILIAGAITQNAKQQRIEKFKESIENLSAQEKYRFVAEDIMRRENYISDFAALTTTLAVSMHNNIKSGTYDIRKIAKEVGISPDSVRALITAGEKWL